MKHPHPPFPLALLLSLQVRTMAYGTDASFYRLNPKLVLKIRNEEEVSALASRRLSLAPPRNLMCLSHAPP